MDQLSCLWRVDITKLFDTAEGIVNEVRTYLAHHSGYTTLCQLGIQCVFFGLKFLCLCSGIDVVGDDSEYNNQGNDEKTTENIHGNKPTLPVA